jgi:hypothetical protein
MSSRPTLTGLPPELMSKIACLACSHDGGRTARNLQLTCKTLADHTSPHRFRTVYLSSSRKINALLNLVERRGSEACPVQHLFISSHVMTPNYAPGRRFELVGKTLEDVDWVDYRPPSSFNQGWTDHPYIISPPTGPDMHSRLFYRNMLRVVDQLRTHLVSFTMVSYFHPPDVLDLHWGMSPRLRTLGFYFKQMAHDTNFSFDTPALRKFTLGVSSGPVNGHWKRLHQVITNNVLLLSL